MHRFIRAALASAILSSPPSIAAQSIWHVGAAGGASFPTGNLGDNADAGWTALATIALSTLMQPLGLRLDAAYNRFAFNSSAAALLGSGSHSVLSATANATYRLPMTNSPASPYLITGLGLYRTDCSAPSCSATNHFGWNAGLGTRLNVAGLQTFLEARYHRTERNEQSVVFVPISLGVMF